MAQILPALIIVLTIVAIVRHRRNVCQADAEAAKAKAQRKVKALSNLRY